MKRICWMVLLALALTLVLGGVASAMTTAVNTEGKTYVFSGEKVRYEVDGKTFLLQGDTVRVQEPGKPDRVLPLASQGDMTLVADGGMMEAGGTATSSMDASVSVGMAVEEAASSVACAATEAVDGSAQESPARFDSYAKYGLSYDEAEDTLYYQGQRVRMFEDRYPLDGNAYSAMEHRDLAGVVDVQAVRDLSVTVYNPDGSYDPGGTLTGLRVLSDAEFQARDLTEQTLSLQTTEADSEGYPMTPAEKKAMYAPYADHGLIYDMQTDTLSYQGQRVRRFLDVRQSNGESFSGGRFKGVMTSISNDDGDVDVTILRDYSRPDAEGNGTITGVEVLPAR